MRIGRLPKELEVGGQLYSIRSDYRDILFVVTAFNDDELNKNEKWQVALEIIYEDYKAIPIEHMEEALQQISWFIDCGDTREAKETPRKVYDFDHDETMIFSAVNKVAGFETRAVEYMHWWTFVGYFMEIGESQFSNILGIRQKLAKRKKLDKYEQEFYIEFKDIIDLGIDDTGNDEELDYFVNLLKESQEPQSQEP